jgi:hypothetical protein
MVTIDFDRTRHLQFDLAAIRDLENAMGGEPLGVIVGRLANLGVNAIVLTLWAGLKHDDRGLSPKLVEKRLTTYLAAGGKLGTLADGINDALEASGLFKVTADEAADPLAPPTPASP